MDITVKIARKEDVSALSAVAQKTFQLAGPLDSNEIEISKYIAENLNESVFQKLVENKDIFIACAQSDNSLVGLIVVKYGSSCPLKSDLRNFAELQRLYVLPEYHGTNASKQLVSAALKKCSENSIDVIWLSVYSENGRAKNFYSKFGFQEIGTTYFHMGSEVHLDTVMVVDIA